MTFRGGPRIERPERPWCPRVPGSRFFGGPPRPMPPCTPYFASPPPGFRAGPRQPMRVVPHILPPQMLQGMSRPPPILGPPPPFPPPAINVHHQGGLVCPEPHHLQLGPTDLSQYSAPAGQGASNALRWGSGAIMPSRPGLPKHVSDHHAALPLETLGKIPLQPLMVPSSGPVIGGSVQLPTSPPIRFLPPGQNVVEGKVAPQTSALPPAEPSSRSPRTTRATGRSERAPGELSGSRTTENTLQNRDKCRSGSDGRDGKHWSDQSGMDDSPGKNENWSISESTRRRERGRDRDRGRQHDHKRDGSSFSDRGGERGERSGRSWSHNSDDRGWKRKSESSRQGEKSNWSPQQKRRREDSRRRDRSTSRRRRSTSREREKRRENRPDDNKSDDLLGRQIVDIKPEIEEHERIPAWIRCSPADLYFQRTQNGTLVSTKKMMDLQERFESELGTRAKTITESLPKYEPPPRLSIFKNKHHHHHSGSESSSSSESESDSEEECADTSWIEALNRKQQHPQRLHNELWFNEEGEMNDGPLCRCSLKAQKSGIRHNIFPGEEKLPLFVCDPNSNNVDKLFHYCITMSPFTNFLTKNPTIIEHDNHEYIFEGFSLFSHYKLENSSACKLIRFNIEYTIHFFEEAVPENFSIASLDLFGDFLFSEILELVDIDRKAPGPEADETWRCDRFHLMPRFARGLPENGKEILSMNEVLNYLLQSSKPLMEEMELAQLLKQEQHDWQNYVDEVRGMVVTYPGKKPSSTRIDQLDRQQNSRDIITYPLIIHFGLRPAQLSYAGDPNYQKMWKQYVKFRHLLNSKPKITFTDKQKLQQKEKFLQDQRMKSTMKREVTVEVSSEGFIRTGIKSDICQHAMLIPVLFGHLRFYQCLCVLEEHLDYHFKDKSLLQLALTHTSYKVNYGTNPDHARNSLSNCGMRQLEYGDRKIHYVHTRKRGINILIDIMSRMGHKDEISSEIPHNERLEFLGDAVVEYITSVHLFFMFPWLEEGGLTTYRAAIVQNQHLAVLAKKLRLQDFMLYAHGPDLCHESDLKHAMANCFEALMGALFIDGGIELADRIFSKTLFDEPNLLQTWLELPKHPLQEDEPNGDRNWIKSSPALQKLVSFEETIGVKFTHVRLLARCFTLRSVGFNNLTLGHNQRLEFLGDTVLQLVTSEYLYKHFPDHHEGHLSLLRSSLVNNKTQSIVCDDLGMAQYIIWAENRGGEKIEMKTKEKADLLEAFIGALFVDKDLDYCRVFCNVCFFPRLKDFIMNQDWNDSKSQLQQCCLTLRELDGGEPDIPIYKVIESSGPTNTRRYTVAVYFRGERLSTGIGHSIQQAEMAAATNALNERSELFPILAHQKRFLERRHNKRKRNGSGGQVVSQSRRHSESSRKRSTQR